MAYLHLAAAGLFLLVVRFLFLLCAPKMRHCSWCVDTEWRRCLRCGHWAQGFRRRREHFRLGAPTACRVRDALRKAYREARARRIARRLGGDL
jgi:hypothetical protein